MKIMEDADGVSIILDQSRKTPTTHMAMGVSRVVKSAIQDGCTNIFVNTRPDRDGRDRVILSLRKPSDDNYRKPEPGQGE